jgi:hypothetical protein
MVLPHEFNILTRLRGKPGVPRVMEFGEWSGGCFMEMELITERLDDRTYSLREITDLAL